MNTPHKNSNYSSPYGQSSPRYPSQSTDFLPLHLGGPNTQGHQNSQGWQKNNQFNQNRQGNRLSHNSRGSGSTYFGQNWQQNKRFQRNFYRGNNRQNKYQSHQNRQEEFGGQDTFSIYFHSSMLEDPWNDLVKRHEALNRSFIDTTEDETVFKEQQSDSDE